MRDEFHYSSLTRQEIFEERRHARDTRALTGLGRGLFVLGDLGAFALFGFALADQHVGQAIFYAALLGFFLCTDRVLFPPLRDRHVPRPYPLEERRRMDAAARLGSRQVH